MLYSQVFVRELSVVRCTSLSMVEQWWQLRALLKSTLPNKVKKFVPKVFYSVSTVCLPRQSALSVRLCHLVYAKVKGQYYNFKQKAVTSNMHNLEIIEWVAPLMTPTQMTITAQPFRDMFEIC